MATGAVVAAAVIGAGASIYSARQNRKATERATEAAQTQQNELIEAQANQMAELFGFTKEQQEEVKRRTKEITDSIMSGNFLGGYDGSDVFGDKVAPALYNSINPTTSLLDTVSGNISALPSISTLVKGVNQIVDDDAMTRARKFIPGFETSQGNLGKATKLLTAGKLPYDDVLDIVSDRQEFSNTLGIPGTNTNASLKDLGMSRMNAINQGGSLLAQMSNIAQSVAPVQSRINPSSQLFDPTTRLQADINQSILDQQSRQNTNILNAAPDPTAAGLFALNSQSDLSNMGVPPIPSLSVPAINVPQQSNQSTLSQILPWIQTGIQLYSVMQK